MIERILGLFAGKAIMLALAAALIGGAWLAHEHAQARLAEAMLAGQHAAREAERKACDAQWTAQIEKSNAEVERRRAALADQARQAEAVAATEIGRLNAALIDMEAKNAALPAGGKCGLDRGRVRLLAK